MLRFSHAQGKARKLAVEAQYMRRRRRGKHPVDHAQIVPPAQIATEFRRIRRRVSGRVKIRESVEKGRRSW